MPRAEDNQRSPLDDVDHLARSPHRARVMQLLADDELSRRDLHEATDIPQPTLGRILGSFQDRHWLERDGHTYALTLKGRLVATHFEHLLNAVETVQHLPAAADFGPFLDLGFDADWLPRLDVVSPGDDGGWFAHIRRARDSVGRAVRVRELAPGPMPGLPETVAETLRTGELTLESVFSRTRFESAVADPTDRRLIREILEHDNAHLYLIDEDVSCYLALQGDRAVLDIPAGEDGPVTRLETSDRTVREWVDSVIDDFVSRAEPVSAEDLAG